MGNLRKELAIVSFAYKRPKHLKKCLKAISENKEAKFLPLIVYVDGPKNVLERDKTIEVINVIKSIKGFSSVILRKREKNFGLYLSLTKGLTEVFKEYKKAIIIEDDIVVSPFFLEYMQKALALYGNQKDVASIHGYTPPIKVPLPNSFFLRGADCWGWATWHDRWKLFRHDALQMKKEIKKYTLAKEFNLNNSIDYLGMLSDRAEGKNNSWAICWHASCFLENKLTLHPGKSLVNNIGLDSSGENCKPSKMMQTNYSQNPFLLKKIRVVENREIFRIYENHFKNHGAYIKSKIIRLTNFKNFLTFRKFFLNHLLKYTLKKYFINKSFAVDIYVYFLKIGYLLKSIFFKTRLNLEGPYKSYKDAKINSDGYEDKVILQKVKNAIIDVLENKAAWERDGSTFLSEKPKQIILDIIKKIYSNKMSIIDYGGGLGSLYINNRNLFTKNTNYYVVEQNNFVTCGKRISKKYNLPINFVNSYEDVKFIPNLIIFSSVLQYLPDFEKLMKRINYISPEYIIIDRTCFSNKKKREWWIQINKNYYSKKITYPIAPINELHLKKLLNKYKVVEEWQNSFDVKKPVHKGLFFSKI